MGKMELSSFLVFFSLLSLMNLSKAESEISLKVAEMARNGTTLVKIPHQLKWPSTEQREYTILSGMEYTQVGTRSGVLKVKKEMDREKLCPDNREHCYIEIAVAVLPFGEKTSLPSLKMVNIRIEITDNNDNVPKFENKIINKMMSEAVEVGTSIRLDSAVDPDYGINSIQTYQIKSATGSRSFEKYFKLGVIRNIDETKIPKLELIKSLDRERQGIHELILEAVDGGRPALTGSATVRINITDSNDNAPTFPKSLYVVEVDEHEAKGKEIIQLNAKDKDIGINGVIVYKFPSVVSVDDREIFDLNSRTGVISVKNSKKLDFETKQIHHLTVEATDMGPNAVSAYTTVTVKVQDVNDNKPEIEVSFMTTDSVRKVPRDSGFDAILMENIDMGTYIAFVTITDKDGGDNGTVSCKIADKGLFSLQSIEDNSSRFLLKIVGTLDREEKNSYYINIEAWDHGKPSQTNSRTLKIKVGDINDNPPQFFHNEFRVGVSETATAGTVIMTLKATDLDEKPGPNSNITYTFLRSKDSIMKGKKKFPLTKVFEIDPVSGEVRLAIDDVLDAETIREPGFLTVLAKDNGKPPLNATTKLKITVIDENDNAPKFEEQSYMFRLDEHSNDGKYIGQVKATDDDWSKDTNGKLTYTIEQFKSEDGVTSSQDESLWLEMFQIDGKTGFIHFYGNKTKLDREIYSDRPIRISVVATDGGVPRSRASVPVEIYLTDINDNHPFVIFPDPKKDIVFVQIPNKNSERKSEIAESRIVSPPPGGLQEPLISDWSSIVVYKESNTSYEPMTLLQIQASDLDEGVNAELSFTIADGDKGNYFEIDTEDGNLTFSETVDVTAVKLGCHVLKILISDLGIPRLSTDAYINVYLSKDNPENVNFTDAMTECQSNPLFPRITDTKLNKASLDQWTIYFIIGFGLLIFIILLVIVIILIKCKCCAKHKKSRSYNCQQGNSTGWNSAGYDTADKKNIKKRGSNRRSYNGQGTVDSRSSFHSEWTASQPHIGQDKLDKVRVLPDLQSEGSVSHDGHDSGTGDSVGADGYHPVRYTDPNSPQDPQDMRFIQLPSYAPMSYSHPQGIPMQNMPYGDHQKMPMTSKCTEECLMYGHSDACWMPDSLLRSPSSLAQPATVDLPPPNHMMYQGHPGDPHGFRYHGDPSTPYYYDPGQKFAHLGNSDQGSGDGFSQVGGHNESIQSHSSFQPQDHGMQHHPGMHMSTPHMHNRMYQNEPERGGAYINLQGYDPSNQNQTEDIHSNLSSASSNTNQYNPGLAQNNPRYRPDSSQPQLFYQVPNQSTPRYDMVPSNQGYYPGGLQDYRQTPIHDLPPQHHYGEDFSASNLLPVAHDKGPDYAGKQWGQPGQPEQQPLIGRYDPARQSEAEPNEQENMLIRNIEASKNAQNNANPANGKTVDEKLSTIEEIDAEAVVAEIDGLLL
uniref:protocadherin-11 Y-linked-like n=1 Tax=Styela clava TaxID=7725 RepID=UPI001939842D|nr:protocadherin-11 Y-linked-like [Styela clava]